LAAQGRRAIQKIGHKRCGRSDRRGLASEAEVPDHSAARLTSRVGQGGPTERAEIQDSIQCPVSEGSPGVRPNTGHPPCSARDAHVAAPQFNHVPHQCPE